MKKIIIIVSIIGFATMLQTSCSDDFLKEKVLDSFSPENVLVDKSGFEAAITALHAFARDEHGIWGGLGDEMSSGTDVATAGVSDTRFLNDYGILTPEYSTVTKYWDWCYTKMIKQSNMIIDRAEYPEVKWSSEEEKNAIVAEAKFFRAYTYNVMAHLYGGIPLADREYKEPVFNFDRASKAGTLEFIKNDLEFAAEHLPVPDAGLADGRIYKAAACHLLAEVYISLAMETGDADYYDKSIATASKIIDTDDCGEYKLMKERFGDMNRPGDVFSDLFWTNQQNRASGNLEIIWALQIELRTNGGIGPGNSLARIFGPQVDAVKTPDGKHTNLPCDSIVRCQGITVPLNYIKYEIWNEDWNDMRNSSYNIRRNWYYNNPASTYLGQLVRITTHSNGRVVIANPDGSPTTVPIDTMRAIYPMHRKIEGTPRAEDPTSGNTNNEIIRMRLAETYLLRAEAYLRKGDLDKAADDINEVRSRAKATPVDPSRVTIDYLLDERARELYIEEPRRLVLSRMGVLYERSIKYNFRANNTMKPFNALFPIPQKAIDANKSVKIKQNTGYPGAEE
ncbi:MAG: RagB/SusD family nutrient uptake outer membrane protein [Candidatus Symbiothrix sp.]|nr:RagB/SusD family nutrient uptake outer membrane protein [Candidatus Symbiothrix sp.]